MTRDLGTGVGRVAAVVLALGAAGCAAEVPIAGADLALHAAECQARLEDCAALEAIDPAYDCPDYCVLRVCTGHSCRYGCDEAADACRTEGLTVMDAEDLLPELDVEEAEEDGPGVADAIRVAPALDVDGAALDACALRYATCEAQKAADPAYDCFDWCGIIECLGYVCRYGCDEAADRCRPRSWTIASSLP